MVWGCVAREWLVRGGEVVVKVVGKRGVVMDDQNQLGLHDGFEL